MSPYFKNQFLFSVTPSLANWYIILRGDTDYKNVYNNDLLKNVIFQKNQSEMQIYFFISTTEGLLSC